MTQSILIIGGGNMGGAMATRWHATGRYEIHVVDTNASRRDALAKAGIARYATLAEAPAADTVVLAIKPQQFHEQRDAWTRDLTARAPLLISIMAGVALVDLQTISPRAVRVMPNLPALIGESMSVLCAPALDEKTRRDVGELFTAIGAVAWLDDEQQMHAATAISGSGPAYLFALMEALQKAATAHGLSPKLARTLVTQTMRGAALLAAGAHDDAATLRAQVTSKGGITQAALEPFAASDFEGMIARVVAAAIARSKQLQAHA
jgi:pyrroline-5-carboxylate reductase